MTGDQASTGVMLWWNAIMVTSVVNVAAWSYIALGVAARRGTRGPARAPGGRWQAWLSAVFVFGCAFRSFLPRAEGQRICVYDTWWSSAILSRSVATVAELGLVAQWTLVLFAWSREARMPAGRVIAGALLPLIAFAEICSWYTALTTNFVGSVVEESTWAVTSTLMTATLIALWLRHREARRPFVAFSILLNAAYIVFMSSVDVPMYLARWQADTAAHKTYLTVGDGARDAARRRVVTRRWQDWRDEMPWMSLYFSAGVWISLSLISAPRLGRLRSAGANTGVDDGAEISAAERLA